MLNPREALTKSDSESALLEPLAPFFARGRSVGNHGAFATLHAYHPRRGQVNAEAKTAGGKGTTEIAAQESARLRFERQAEGGDSGAHQLLNTRVAMGVACRQSGGSSVADQRLLFAAELG